MTYYYSTQFQQEPSLLCTVLIISEPGKREMVDMRNHTNNRFHGGHHHGHRGGRSGGGRPARAAPAPPMGVAPSRPAPTSPSKLSALLPGDSPMNVILLKLYFTHKRKG